MSNMDILMGVVAILTYIFVVCPVLVIPFGSDANYLESVLGGLIMTLVCVVIVVVGISIWMCVAYFAGYVKPDTPFTDMVDWVNSL